MTGAGEIEAVFPAEWFAEGTTCWVPVTVDRTYGHRFMADGGGHFHQEEAIPDSPALRAVAAWLAANPDAAETLRDLAYIVGMAAEVCGWKGTHVPSPLRVAVLDRFTDARYQQLRALLAALSTDGGA